MRIYLYTLAVSISCAMALVVVAAPQQGGTLGADASPPSWAYPVNPGGGAAGG